MPHIVGYQAAGTVAEVGADVEGFAVGDRAVTVGLDGSHAARRAVPAGFAWKIPDGVSTDDAAAVPVPFGTADDCLFEFGRLQAGETALIHAGAGGVGIAAIQMAKRAGARVLSTASSDERLERLKELGLDEGINYRTHDFVAEARRLTDGRGVDVVVDSVGATTLQGSINVLAYRGRCVSVGDAGRDRAEMLDISNMRPNNQTFSGYFMGAELLLAARAGPRHDRRAPRRHRPRRAEGGHRPHLPAVRRGRGARLHREPPGLRPGPARPLTSRA